MLRMGPTEHAIHDSVVVSTNSIMKSTNIIVNPRTSHTRETVRITVTLALAINVSCLSYRQFPEAADLK